MTDDSLLPFDLPASCRKKMTAAFDGGRLVLGRWGTATARGGAASGHRWPRRRRPSRDWYTGKSLPEADRPEDETGTGGSSSRPGDRHGHPPTRSSAVRHVVL